MSFSACLAQLQADGKIDAERVDRYQGEWDRLNRAYAKTMGSVDAAEAATRDAMDGLEFKAVNDRRQKLKQISTQRSILTGLIDHVQAPHDYAIKVSQGGKAGHYAKALMDHHEAVPGVASVDNTRAALFNLTRARMGDFLSRYGRDMLGRVRRGDELHEVVRVLRGEASDNADAREMGAAVKDALEWLRVQYNQAGGSIGKLANWGLPQSHDALLIAKATFPGWRDFIKQHLDPGSMIDNSTGKAFASEAALDDALEAGWRNITSEGMDGAVPGAFTGQGKLANRRIDHRFLIFKNADSWMAYNDRFGSGDAFDAINGHIDSMTRDIAAMQVLGPNPALTVRWLDDLLRQGELPRLTSGKGIVLDKHAVRGAGSMSRMWDYYSGALNHVAPEDRGRARFFSGLRNLNVMSKIGSAFLSALPTDPMFAGVTAYFNGLPVMDDIGAWLKTFNPLDPAHREAAMHSGLVFHEMTQRAEKIWRDGQGLNVHELTSRGADMVLRGQLLAPHTVARKMATGLSFMKDWADHAGEAFDHLAEDKRISLERYGIDRADWDRLRATPLVDQGTLKLLRPGDLVRGSDDPAALATAVKFFSMIDSETRFAVPDSTLRAQTAVATLGGAVRMKRGTWGGELLHSGSQFKTYSVTVMMTHLERALYGRGGMSRASYAITLPILLTLGGFIANSLIELANGKDPSPFADPLTLGRAIVRGGGAGMLGDLAGQGLSGDRQAGGGLSGFVLGPTMGTVVDPLYNLTLGNIGAAASGDKTTVGAELVRGLRRNLPGGNVWYARAAVNRLMMDRLQELADPHYRQSWRRMNRAAAENGTQFYWAPGDSAPERAPDLSNAFDGETVR